MTSISNMRFVPSYKARGKSPGYGTLGQFMVSDQLFKPVFRAGLDIVAIARTLVDRSDDPRDGHYADSFTINPAKQITRQGSARGTPRVMVQISNSADNAVAVEFGSGSAPIGVDLSGAGDRPQGGYSDAKRPLNRAGRKIGRGFE